MTEQYEKELREALERLISNAEYGINSGDHEIMNPDGFKRDMKQHEADVQTIKAALGELAKTESKHYLATIWVNGLLLQALIDDPVEYAKEFGNEEPIIFMHEITAGEKEILEEVI